MEKEFITHLNVEWLWDYKEFDRIKKPFLGALFLPGTNMKELEESIPRGFEHRPDDPVTLTIYKGKALLTEGNHRVGICKKMRIQSIPVKVRMAS